MKTKILCLLAFAVLICAPAYALYISATTTWDRYNSRWNDGFSSYATLATTKNYFVYCWAPGCTDSGHLSGTRGGTSVVKSNGDVVGNASCPYNNGLPCCNHNPWQGTAGWSVRVMVRNDTHGLDAEACGPTTGQAKDSNLECQDQ